MYAIQITTANMDWRTDTAMTDYRYPTKRGAEAFVKSKLKAVKSIMLKTEWKPRQGVGIIYRAGLPCTVFQIVKQ